MKPQAATRPRHLRRYAVTTVIFVSVAINVVLLATFFSRTDRADEASRAPAAGRAGSATSNGSALPIRTEGGDGRQARSREVIAPPPSERARESAPPESHGTRGPRTEVRTPGRPDLAANEPLAPAAETREAPGGVGPAVPIAMPTPPRSDAAHSTPPDPRPTATERQDYPTQPPRPDTQAEPTPTSGDAPPDEESPGSDRSPPVLESLRFDPPEIADGGAASLLLQVSDNLSGVKSVSGSLRSPSGAAMLPFQAQGDSGGGAFVARLAIPAKAERGVWYLAYLSVLDKADNPLVGSFTAQSAPAGGRLRVLSGDSDSTPPEVHRVSVEKRSVNGGEQNVVIIDIVDDHSGVASMMGAFQSSSKAALLRFVGRATNAPNVWEGEVSIPASAECGEWTVQFLRAVDNAGNIAYLSSDSQPLAGVGFNVSSSGCDSTPPTLESLTLAPTSVSNASAAEIQVTATVRDDGSGAASMLGWVNGPVATNGQLPRIFFSCARARNDPDAPWTGKIIVPQHAAAGIWKMGLVRLLDKANNSRDYGLDDPIVSRSNFEVQ